MVFPLLGTVEPECSIRHHTESLYWHVDIRDSRWFFLSRRLSLLLASGCQMALNPHKSARAQNSHISCEINSY